MLLQFASFLVLARLLTPDDFGVVGMVIPFAILANVIANGGLQITVIQRVRAGPLLADEALDANPHTRRNP